MKLLNKAIFVTMFTGLISMSYSNVAGAEEMDSNHLGACGLNEVISADKSKTMSMDSNGIETIEIDDPDTLNEIENYIDKPESGKDLKGFEIKRDTKIVEENKDSGEVQPQFITSIQQTSRTSGCGSERIGYTSGTGEISLSVSESVQTTTSANISIGIDRIGTELGRSIQSSLTVTSSTTHDGGSDGGEIIAYPSLNITNFDVYRFGLKAESGSVMIADGVCFAKY